VITVELAQFMAELSRELRRQVGVLIDRRGKIEHVMVGDAQRLEMPDLGRARAARERLRGVRLVHTHLHGEPLSRDDLTDLSLLRFDLIGVIQVSREGQATTLEIAHLVPPGGDGKLWETLPPFQVGEQPFQLDELLAELEGGFSRQATPSRTASAATRAIAVHVQGPGEVPAEESLAELEELARTAGVQIAERVSQRRREIDPRYVVGRGKLIDLTLAAMHQGADLIIFDRDLTASQANAIAEITEFKVIDRTQLILDIFATRATTQGGKLQVELAQLKYSLPRLGSRNTALSRLTGGIGGRGPGETKLEIDRRRAKDRIRALQGEVEKLAMQRRERRRKRQEARLPVASIVGYTNAGKSTLLNTITGSEVLAEDKLFATLDPASRRLWLTSGREIIITDTVGFIRDLPDALVAAFMATLEEIKEASVLIHVVDIATPGWEDRMPAVDRVLARLEADQKPQIVVFNKADRVPDKASLEALCRIHGGIPLSAIDKRSLAPLTERLARTFPEP
jgi:GTP-binding protein HflX